LDELVVVFILSEALKPTLLDAPPLSLLIDAEESSALLPFQFTFDP
jgi:hypothetical protein